MKKLACTLLAVGVAVSALAQGTVNFTTVSGSTLRAPIYFAGPGEDTQKTGNTATGIPSGTQTYTGALLTGSGYTVQIWAASGAGALESALQASPGAMSTFRTGSAAGFVAAQTGTLAGVAKDAPAATLQLRVWDNGGGTITSWTQALTGAVGGGPLTAAYGKSGLWTVNSIGGDINTPPFLTGVQSFNVVPVPEPSTFVLAGLGAAGLLIFRRRK
jgi:hypothetical protein